MGMFSSDSLFKAAANPFEHAQSEDSFLGAVGGGGSGGKKGGAPAAPDYIGMAREQGQQNMDLARTNARLNNPSITTPMGSRSVAFGADTLTPAQQAARGPRPTEEQEWERYNAAHMEKFGSPVPRGVEQQGHVKAAMQQRLAEWAGVSPDASKIVETLNPQAQRIFDTQQRTAGNLAGQVEQNFSQPFSFASGDDLQNKAEQAYLSRAEPQMERSRDALRSKLAVQGIDPYGEAANREYERQSFQENDVRTQAILKAFGMRPQMLQEEIAIRSLPMSEMSSVLSGQVQTPQFQNFQGVNAQGAPLMDGALAQGAYATDQYNAQAMRQAGLQNGLFSLGAAAIPFMFSDRRLKSNIVKVGDDVRGFGIYEYDIFGKRERGVMADEVQKVIPEAVTESDSGYLMVDYGMLQWH